MSKFIDSFKREVGKNAGKWVSNKLFGDKHATPIKIIRKREDDPHAVQHAVERALKNSGSTPYFPTPSRNDTLDSSATSYKPIIQYQPNNTPNTKDPLKEIKFDLNDEKGIIVQLYRIQAFFETAGWKSGNSYADERNNSESDRLLSKLHEGCKMLEIMNPTAPQLPQFHLFLHKLHRKRWWQRYGLLIYSFGSMLIVLILSLIMMHFED